MKMTNYISQLNSKEQNAIFCIKKLIAAQLQPLRMDLFCCETIQHSKRSAFTAKQFKEERRFTCDLLLITADEAVIDLSMKTEIQELIAHFGKVNMIIHPLGFVLKQMNEGNLFFNWIHKEGMLLLDRNNSTQLLPAPVEGTYRQQAAQFYASNPNMANYLEVKFEPPVKPEPKKVSAQPSQPLEIKLTLDAANGWQPTATKM
jgi:hypothetical protein